MSGHDSILERARLLAAAANQMADQMSVQVAHLAEHAQSRREESQALEETKKKQEIQRQEVEREKNARLFKGAAIAGSSLVTTYGDIRPYVPRGSVIKIDGNVCRLLEKGEYTASRVELVEDYRGETNLDVSIEVGFENSSGTKSPKKNKAKVVPTDEVRGAVALLDGIKFPSATFAIDIKPSPGKKKAKAAQSDIKASNGSNKNAYPDMSAYIVNPTPSSRDAPAISSVPPPLPLLASGRPAALVEEQASARVDKDDNIAYTMLQELQLKEAYGYPQQSYLNMNKRMASEGRQKAKERVLERKKRMEEQAQEQLFSQMEALNPDPIQVVEKRLEMERRKALARAAQKKREDEQRLLVRLEQERVEQEALKQKMKEKADQLAIATAERVEKLKREKLLAQQREAEMHEAELQRKREAQAAVADRAYEERVEKLRQQTQDRLNRIRQQEIAKQQEEAEEAARKLRELAEARGRGVPMSQMASLNGGSHDSASRYGGSRDGSRPSSVGAAQSLQSRRHSAPTKKTTQDNPSNVVRSAKNVPIVPSVHHLPPLPSGSSASASGSDLNSAALRSSSGGSKYRAANPPRTMLYNGKAVPRSDQSQQIASARLGAKANSMLIREHTPIQTERMPAAERDQNKDDDLDVSGDSLDDREGENRAQKASKNQPASYGAMYRNHVGLGGPGDNFDNMSLVSALTGDDGTWAGVHSNSISEQDIANRQRSIGIPQPPQKRRAAKTPVWRKLQPIEVKPYVPVPNASP